MSRFTVPIGPQHPLLKEPLSFQLTLEGEEVVDSVIRLGYVHRGIERLSEKRTYIQNVHLVERVCGICSHVHTTTYCMGVESLAGVTVPVRGLYLRTFFCELERIHSHLLWLGVLAKNLGFDTVFMYAWRDREIVLDIMEELSGGRVSHAANVIGGVRVDINDSQRKTMTVSLKSLSQKITDLRNIVEHETNFHARTRDIGTLTAEQIRQYCIVGPIARASNVDVDMRRDVPYNLYEKFDFSVITRSEGDVWARTTLRIQEAQESIKICLQILDSLPPGAVAVRAKRRVPPGEVICRSEAPRGELLYYIQSDGSDRPARIKIRTPTLPSLAILPDLLRGINMADVSAVVSGVDLCIACVDR
ncbi:MAG: nickel-dependent hydrogenase large subunit [Anaerolineaceae bacterium]|nr:nickel-dependent hydrogenase large subunit [Anaerolineaceae bacterium]